MMMLNQIIDIPLRYIAAFLCRFRSSALLIGIFLFSSASIDAQEICNNGIDDDGDNLVDVFDPDCPCDDQVLLCQPSCEFVSPGGQLNFSSQWSSAETVPVYQTPLVGDIDNDDVPEVLFLSSNSLVGSDPRRARDILVINGASGATELTISTPFVAWVGPTPFAIADIDGDGFGEIILAAMNHSDNDAADRGKLFCYEHTGALKWVSDSTFGSASTQRFGSSVGIADFNNDGIAEVHVYNRIFNAQTGVLLASGGNSGASGTMTNQAFGDLANAVAADITTDPGLELAAGNTVYNVTITNTTGLTGNAMIPITIPGQPDGYTSVADIDLDGNLDLVVASQGSTASLYVWNPGNGVPFLVASVSLPNTGGNWIGVPFIGDMDKDCQPEIGVTRSRRVYALDYDGSATLASKWTLITTDASGFTGITMFDFNQDGTQELVYRDESQLRIIDGSGNTPVTIGTNVCGSGTGSEMPVVADVDGDGQAEICVSCSTIDIQQGTLQVFESAGQPWAPCRSVWNQFGYFNVNINANLSVPIQQQQHQILLSTVTCPFYNCNENRPFNTFLAQATFLTQEGCPIYPASNVALANAGSSCNGSALYELSLNITNVGSAPSDSGYPIRFYAGNPFNSAAIPLPVISGPNATSNALDPDEIEQISFTIDISQPDKPFTLYAILNDAGNLTPPFAFPLSSLPECDYTDNVILITNIDCCPFGDLSIDNLIPPSAEFCEGGSQVFRVQASSSAGLTASEITWTLPGNININADSITVSDAGTYSVSVTDDAQCSVSQNFQVVSVPLPTAAAAGVDQQICEDQTVMQANTPNVGTGAWTVISGSASVANPGSPTSTVNNLQVGSATLVWTITNGASCTSSDTIVITRVSPPDAAAAGPDQQVCDSFTTLSANTPAVGTGSWSVVSGSGTFSDINNPLANVSGLATGTNVFRWTISSGDCTPQTDDVVVERFIQPTGDFAGPDQSICSDVTQLNAQGAGVWSFVSGSATISDVSDNQATVTNLIPGLYELEWTVTIGACPAVSDTMVISFVPPPSPAQAGPDLQVCDTQASLSALTPVSGLGFWSVVSGSASIFNPGDSFTSVSNLSAGANVFVYTVSTFGVCPVSTDTIVITRDLNPDIAVAGSDAEVCGTEFQLNGNVATTGNALWTIVSGDAVIQNPTTANASLTFNSPGAVVLQYTISNGVCPPSADEVTIASFEPPQNVNAGADFSVCDESAVLNASTPSAGNGLWTIVSGNAGIATPGNPQSEISLPDFGSVVLQWTVNNGACSDSDQVAVTRTAPPSLASAGSDQELCGNTAQLSANTPAQGSGAWSVIQGSASFSNASIPDASVSGLSTGINLLVWTITSGNCPPSADTAALTVSQDPVEPSAGPDQSICSDQTTLNALAPPEGTAQWSIVSGNAQIEDPVNPQSALLNISPGTVVLRWTITNGACIAFDEVVITRSELPTQAIAGSNDSICEGSSLNLNANLPVSGTGAWSSVSPEIVFTNSSDPQTSASGFSPGIYSLVWTISSGACPPSADSILVTVSENNAIAQAGPDQTICADSITINQAVAANGTILWDVLSGAATISNPASSEILVTGLQPGITILSLTVSNGVCPAVSDEVQITVNALPDTANAGNDQQVCGNNTTLQANLPVSGNGLWTLVTGNAVFDDPSNPNSGVTGLDPGVNVLQWSISSGLCPESTDQVIIISDSISIANAGNDLQSCNGSELTLQAVEPNPGNGLWTIASGNGSFSDPSNPLSSFTPLQNGTSILVWTVSTGNCPPASDTLTVESFELPGPAFAGNDTSVCSTLLSLAALEPVSGNGVWSSPQQVSFSDPNSNTAEVSMLNPGTTLLIWTVSNGNCPAVADTLELVVNKQPITPNAGPDQSICAFETQLSAGIPPSGSGLWSIIEGNANISDPSSANSAVSELLPGITLLRWTVTAGECIAFDDVQIEVSEPPSQADAGPDATVCSDSASLQAVTPTIGVGTWSLIDGSAQIEDASSPTTTVTGLSAGETTLAWTITSGACKPSVDFVVLTRDTTIPPATAGEDLNICADTASLNAVPAPGGFWQLVSGSAVLADSSQATSAVSNIQVGTTVLEWIVPASGACPESRDQLTITRSEPPSEAILGEDLLVCTDEIELTANQPAVGTGTWLVVSGNATITDPSSAITTATGLEPGNNVFEWRITNGSCPPETEQITIARGDTAFAGPDQTICDSSATLSAALPAGLSGFWTLVSGSGILADSSQAQTSVSNLAQGENVFLWTVLGGFCPDSTDLVSITVACNTPPVIINDTLVVLEDSVLTGSLLNGDFDPDSTELTADTVLVVEPGSGTFVVNPDGSFIYTPDPDFFGNDTIVVQICDNGSPLPVLCDNDTIYITVLPVNDPPLLVSDEVSTTPGQSISGNINDNNSDPEGDSLVVNTDPVSGPGNGTIIINPDGSYIYTPDEGFVGSDTVVVEICDDPIPGTDSFCGLDTLIIVVQLQEIFADAGNDTTICGTSTNLNASIPSAGTGQWTVIQGNANIQNPSDPNTIVTGLSTGENSFVWTVTDNGQSASDTVVITVVDVPPAFAGEDQLICGSETTLSGNDVGNAQVLWEISGGAGNIANAESPTAFVSGLLPGFTTITYTVSVGDCFSTDSLTINALTLASVALQADTAICPQTTSVQITGLANPPNGNWAVLSGNAVFESSGVSTSVSELAPGNNVLLFTTGESPCSANDTLVITVLPETDVACAGIFIPEGFSPNGDGSNDNFVIYGTENLSLTLKVFNRWGNLVYESDNYQGTWNGTCNQGGVLYGELLPAGTYYYLVQIQGETETRKGYLTLWR